MNLVTVLHNKAMEFADEATIAKAKGNPALASALFHQAFLLENEAALNAPVFEKDPVPRLLLVRSAASLAMISGNHVASERLIAQGFSEKPPKFLEMELSELNKELNGQKRKVKEQADVQISGVLTSVNAASNEIKIQDAQNQQTFSIITNSKLMKNLVSKYFMQAVHVSATVHPNGILVVKNIQKAA